MSEKINNSDYGTPDFEEFEKQSNREDDEAFNFDDVISQAAQSDDKDAVDDNDNNSGLPFGKELFDDAELSDLIATNKEARAAAEFLKKYLPDEKDEPAVIKKKDADKMGYVKISELSEGTVKEYKTQKTKLEIENQPHEEYLKENFKDFLTVPKISGTNSHQNHNNLIPSNQLNTGDSYTEIAADPTTEDISHPSTVEINRNENGEIESIVVYCKCGERTMIKFDYDDNAAELTSFAGNEDFNDDDQ